MPRQKHKRDFDGSASQPIKRTKRGTVQSRDNSNVARKHGKKNINGAHNGSDSSDDNVEGIDIDWKKNEHELSWALIAAITENAQIKQGLFPMPGMDTMKSKGRPKTEFQYQVAQILFGNDQSAYKEAFEAATATKEKNEWGRKIKNRIQYMTKACQKYRSTMGNTGQGIKRGSEIDMSKENVLTTAWAIVQKPCPWYFEFNELISERPNATPHGLANSSDTFDVDSLIPDRETTSATDELGSDGLGLLDEEMVKDDDTLGFDGDVTEFIGIGDDTGDKEVGEQRDGMKRDSGRDGDPTDDEKDTEVGFNGTTTTAKAEIGKTSNTETKRTFAKPATSRPTPTVGAKAKGKTFQERFTEIAVKEEETTQQVMKLKADKLRMQFDRQQHENKVQADIQMNRDRLQAELNKQREEHKFKLKMAKLELKMLRERGKVVPTEHQQELSQFSSFKGLAGDMPGGNSSGWASYSISSSSSQHRLDSQLTEGTAEGFLDELNRAD